MSEASESRPRPISLEAEDTTDCIEIALSDFQFRFALKHKLTGRQGRPSLVMGLHRYFSLGGKATSLISPSKGMG